MKNIMARIVYVILTTAGALIWSMQSSISNYWLETRHRAIDIPDWVEPAWWPAGKNFQAYFEKIFDVFGRHIHGFDENSISEINNIWFDSALATLVVDKTGTREDLPAVELPAVLPEERVERAGNVAVPEILVAQDFLVDKDVISGPDNDVIQENTVTQQDTADKDATGPVANENLQITLQVGDKVFFVGDSMMQGVAPHVRRVLSRTHHIDSIDLSKQSTGLSYSGFFNWPGTVAETFAKHPEIRLMVVFLGPNDPWDFPSGKGQPYLKFQSDEWEDVYRSRVRMLLHTAQSYGARVIWLEVPTMKRRKLNQQIGYLNDLYQSEVIQAGEVFITLDEFFGNPAEDFSFYSTVNGRSIRVRIDDGIHFTVAGQRLVAEEIMRQVEIKEAE